MAITTTRPARPIAAPATAASETGAAPRPLINIDRRRTAAPSVEEIERALVARDGADHVEGCHLPGARAVALERRRVAERIRHSIDLGFSYEHAMRASEVRAIWNAGKHTCGWCENPIEISADVYPLGGRLLHDPQCLWEFEMWAKGSEEDQGSEYDA